ncbi:hypothetical protein AMATHDRAFT_59164 [Amanita thiersii Skay4041]|uniref:Vacuolar ATPase assembly integral membrane protein VMA21 n=1 Tax=Amanita thiersii Skay4041 TaxID=703135 RepID=A0A2A9NQ24_9AGAR|nr:hypothetical protein AMATHDRAFT_59164 [Amanita thiersii Skay4041]
MSEKSISAQVTSQAASGGILIKLIVFSLSLGIMPIVSYFASLKYIWNGNSTYAAITAVVAANVVLVAYIVSSIKEDRQAQQAVAPSHIEPKKQR